MSNPNPLDTGDAFEIELSEPNPSSRRTKDGAHFWVKFRVDEATHSAFMNARESNLRLIGRMVALPDTDEEAAIKKLEPKPKKAKPVRGPWGDFWQALFIAGFPNCPGVREAINDIYKDGSPSSVKDALHNIFETVSLTFIAPDTVIARFPGNSAVATMVSQAERKAAA